MKGTVHITAVSLLLACAGCHIFDAKLFEEATDGGVGGNMNGGSGGSGGSGGGGGGQGSDMATPLPPGDGGVVDLGPPPGTLCGRSTPASLCPGSYLFCDGFEDESGSSFTHWSDSFVDNVSSGSAANPGTSLSVDSSMSCLGTHALHGTTVGKQQEAVVIRSFSAWPNPVHVRFFMYIRQHTSTVGLVEFRDANGDFASLFLDPPTASVTTSRFGLETFFTTNLMSLGPEITLPTDRWICVELTMKLDPINGEAHVSVDDSPIGDRVGVQTASSKQPMDRMAFGPVVEDSGTSLSTNDIWLDEVAVSGSPIGCM